jgi:type III secretion protein J
MRRFAAATRITLAMLAFGLLCSCQSDLYSHVSERDANEILSTLYSAGIHAGKSTHEGKTWSVEVDQRDLQRALEIVSERGLPREQFASTGDLFKKEGLVSTPSEERIRYIFAVSQELSNTLSQIDGVIAARVHPVIPANDPLATQIRPSSAAIFIKYRHDANLEAMAPAIKNLVMHSIEGLQYEDVSLTFVAADDNSRSGSSLTPTSGSQRPIKAVLGGVGGLVLLAIGGLGYLWRRYRPAERMAAKHTMRGILEANAGGTSCSGQELHNIRELNRGAARHVPHQRIRH